MFNSIVSPKSTSFATNNNYVDVNVPKVYSIANALINGFKSNTGRIVANNVLIVEKCILIALKRILNKKRLFRINNNTYRMHVISGSSNRSLLLKQD